MFAWSAPASLLKADFQKCWAPADRLSDSPLKKQLLGEDPKVQTAIYGGGIAAPWQHWVCHHGHHRALWQHRKSTRGNPLPSITWGPCSPPGRRPAVCELTRLSCVHLQGCACSAQFWHSRATSESFTSLLFPLLTLVVEHRSCCCLWAQRCLQQHFKLISFFF